MCNRAPASKFGDMDDAMLCVLACGVAGSFALGALVRRGGPIERIVRAAGPPLQAAGRRRPAWADS
jgi:hypothetical protein